MFSQDEIDQIEENYKEDLERHFTAKTKYKASPTAEAAEFVSYLDKSIVLLLKKICNEKWMCQWASRQPVSAITYLNDIHQELQQDPLWDFVNQAIQTSNVFKILQTERPKEFKKYFNFEVATDVDLRLPAVLDFFDAHNGRTEKSTPAITNQFQSAANDFRTVQEVLEVRDEARRRLVSHALISHDFKTRTAAYSIGCKSDGALAGCVRVLFGTPDYKRETIEPVITNWKHQVTHPFQPVIEELVGLGTLSKVEAQIQEFYPAIIMKAAPKCQFVKVRMAEALKISEKTVTSFLTSLELDDWYAKTHKEFLQKTFETVGYNYSQAATLLNVDVRYITQQIAHYGIEKPNGKATSQPVWPYQMK